MWVGWVGVWVGVVGRGWTSRLCLLDDDDDAIIKLEH